MKDEKHVVNRLSPYVDGELSKSETAVISEHLDVCNACNSEFDNLKILASLIKSVPTAQSLSPSETFTTQVGLLLPRKMEKTSAKRFLENSWRLLPGSILVTWAFLQAVFIVTGIVTFSLRFVPETVQFASGKPFQSTGLSSILSNFYRIFDFGLVGVGKSLLDLSGGSELFSTFTILNISLTLFIGLIYLSWMASWWIQQKEQPI